MSKNVQQHENDALREQVRQLSRQLEAAQEEVAVARSGKPEARSIAESAEVLAAERDQWKQRYAELASRFDDLHEMVRHYEANQAPPPQLARKVYAWRNGHKLDNGVPPKAVQS